jgi:transposase
LDQALLARSETLVQVPPRLMAGARRAGRRRGRSDPIDALAVARAALLEPHLSVPRPEEAPLRELKLLLDDRDDLVAERTRIQQRLRWHLHELALDDVPAGPLDRTAQLQRLGRRLARRAASVQVEICRDLVRRCRTLTSQIVVLERRISERVTAEAPALLTLPGCGPLTAAKLLAEIGSIERFSSDAQLGAHAGVAPLPASSGARIRHRLD